MKCLAGMAAVLLMSAAHSQTPTPGPADPAATQPQHAVVAADIKTARAYLAQGDKGLAVQWVMASRIENTRVRDWLGNHPDAVLEALSHCCW